MAHTFLPWSRAMLLHSGTGVCLPAFIGAVEEVCTVWPLKGVHKRVVNSLLAVSYSYWSHVTNEMPIHPDSTACYRSPGEQN